MAVGICILMAKQLGEIIEGELTPEGQSRTKKPRAKKPKAKKPGRRKGSEEDGQTNWKLRNQICPVYEKPKLVRHTWRISLQGGNRAGLHRLRDSVAGLHRRRRRFRFIYAACFFRMEAREHDHLICGPDNKR